VPLAGHGDRTSLAALHDSFGYCGWCLHHALDWKAGPRDAGTALQPGWRVFCKLDGETTHAYGTCSLWVHILMTNGLFFPKDALPPDSAHRKAEMIRAKAATYRWVVPTRGDP